MEKDFINITQYAPVGLLLATAMLLWAIGIYRSATLAERIVKKQYEPASKKLVDGVIDYGCRIGKEEKAVKIVTKVRTKLGHNNVKIGHIAWMLKILEGEVIFDENQIPTFEKPKTDK